eukprot:jgi/Botrbrau1/5831/Bobra.0366s0013.1
MGKRPLEGDIAADDRSPKRQAPSPQEGTQGHAETRGLPAVVQAAEPSNKKDGLELPTGWLDCPRMGSCLENPWRLMIVPMKVPLSSRFDSVVPERSRFQPSDVKKEMERRRTPLGLVVDLTNSFRYYKPEDWEKIGVGYYKIRCRGHGEVPSPENVNDFMEVISNWDPACGHYIAVHCTHGFNRTGYMIVNLLVRKGLSVATAIQAFAKVRSPGIYKPDYLEKLFLYNHERKVLDFRVPSVPLWKQQEPDSPGRDGLADESEATGTDWERMIGAEGEDLHHDDLLGEAVHPDMEGRIQMSLMQTLLGPYSNRVVFPGSQPVSLSRDNMDLLDKRRYWVTWKADGTRYLLYIMPYGTFLVDRSFNVRRVQMRFPLHDKFTVDTSNRPHPGRMCHDNTVLDGEMVVDDNIETGLKTRRFLAYDLIMLNGNPVHQEPFKQRLMPWPQKKKAPPFQYPLRYEYDKEPFRVRRKDFYPLYKAPHVLEKLMPQLSHETDGLILQGYEDVYVPQTCEELLKWKYAHLNSVDFLLRENKGEWMLMLNETRREGKEVGEHGRGLVPLRRPTDDGKDEEYVPVVFPDEETRKANKNKIVECSWNDGNKTWEYMRTRVDKDTPNAYHVYEKVKKSIDDRILEDDLLARMELALKEEPYEEDLAIRDAIAAGLPPPKFPKVRVAKQQTDAPAVPPTNGDTAAVRESNPSDPLQASMPLQGHANGTTETRAGATGDSGGAVTLSVPSDLLEDRNKSPPLGNGVASSGSPHARESGAVLQHPLPSGAPLELQHEQHARAANGAVEHSRAAEAGLSLVDRAGVAPDAHLHQENGGLLHGVAGSGDFRSTDALHGSNLRAQNGASNSAAVLSGSEVSARMNEGTLGGGSQENQPSVGGQDAAARVIPNEDEQTMIERLLAERKAERERAAAPLATQQA